MKCRKPCCTPYYFEIRAFYDSLPDEFEIVPEGHVCVKWPEGLWRDRLQWLADSFDYLPTGALKVERDVALLNLAAIAPERKKRNVALWIKPNGDQVWCGSCGEGWRKVGEGD